MNKPLVAIVGRPNVGKSTFFNKIAGKRISIVEDVPGVTRDRIHADAEWLGHAFTLVDTGGIDPHSDDALLSQMRAQAQIAIDLADVICFFTDAREGLTEDDKDVSNLLRRTGKPVILVVNKIDYLGLNDSMYEFYELGLGDPLGISSVNMLGFGDLLDRIVSFFPDDSADNADTEEPAIQVAIVGRPNVGKSSLTNRLLGQERTMVSNIPGTTRDAIDAACFSEDGTAFNLIDTAGMRKKSSIEGESLERYSVLRSIAAIRRCDVALVLIDANDGVTEQDTKIAGLVHEEGKAAIIVVNKWDALEKETGTLEKYRKEVIEKLKFMDYAPVMFVSAKTGQRVQSVFQKAREVYETARRRITTGVLNDVLNDATDNLQPPLQGTRRLKIYYATQTGVQPPTFVLFVNDEKLMSFSYERYLENYFRKTFPLEGTPIRFVLRERKEKENN